MIFAVPVDIPVTIPETSTVAIAVFPLDQVPDGVVFVNVVAVPMHSVPVPDMAAGLA